jgi:hypothetical protein
VIQKSNYPTPDNMYHTFLLSTLLLSSGVFSAPAPAPSPTGVPTTSAALTELAALTVAAQGSQDGYSRDLFPHWITISGNCDTRETVLKRDGTNVVQSSSCAATSGIWVSPYDGATWYIKFLCSLILETAS